MSSLFAVLSVVLVYMGVYSSYMADGAGGTLVGVLGVGAFVSSTIGFIVGARSFKNEEAFLGLPWFGVVSNAVIWLFMMCVIFIGI